MQGITHWLPGGGRPGRATPLESLFNTTIPWIRRPVYVSPTRDCNNARAADLLRETRNRIRGNFQIVQMLVAIVILYTICWTPSLIDDLMVAYGVFCDMAVSIELKYFRMICKAMAYFNSCINPIVYGFMSKNFRATFLEACGCGYDRLDQMSRYSTFTGRGRTLSKSSVSSARFRRINTPLPDAHAGGSNLLQVRAYAGHSCVLSDEISLAPSFAVSEAVSVSQSHHLESARLLSPYPARKLSPSITSECLAASAGHDIPHFDADDENDPLPTQEGLPVPLLTVSVGPAGQTTELLLPSDGQTTPPPPDPVIRSKPTLTGLIAPEVDRTKTPPPPINRVKAVETPPSTASQPGTPKSQVHFIVPTISPSRTDESLSGKMDKALAPRPKIYNSLLAVNRPRPALKKIHSVDV